MVRARLTLLCLWLLGLPNDDRRKEKRRPHRTREQSTLCQNHAVNLVTEFVKNFVVPGSTWFLMFAGSICAGLSYGTVRMRKVGRALLAVLLILYWVMSLPVVALALQRVQFGHRAENDGGGPVPLPVVVLGNGLGGYSAFGGTFEVPLGQTAMNTLFALERFHRFPGSILIASGGSQPGATGGSSEAAVIADALRRNGVPSDHIVLETTSTTTREQAVAVGEILRARGDTECILVTSPQQMSRAADVFRGVGIATVPLPAGAVMWSPSESAHWWSWIVPSSQARVVSRDVLYELVAWPYYRIRGWVR
jgi:uncharacterized SAM-binding protein YcdF (DUF218 family)